MKTNPRYKNLIPNVIIEQRFKKINFVKFLKKKLNNKLKKIKTKYNIKNITF